MQSELVLFLRGRLKLVMSLPVCVRACPRVRSWMLSSGSWRQRQKPKTPQLRRPLLWAQHVSWIRLLCRIEARIDRWSMRIDRLFGLARSNGWFEGAISDGFVEEKRRIFTGLLGCLKSGFCCSLCGSLVFVLGLGLGCSGSGYIVVLCFLNASVLFLRSGRWLKLLPGVTTTQPGVCACLFSLQQEPPTRPGSCFMFPDVSWTLRSGRKFLRMLLLLLQQRSIPLLFSALRFHCFLMQMAFYSGWGWRRGAQLLRCGLESVLGFWEMKPGWKGHCFGPMNQYSFEGESKKLFQALLGFPPLASSSSSSLLEACWELLLAS